MNIQRGTSTDD